MKRARLLTGTGTGLVLAHGRGGSAGDILGPLAHSGLPDVAALAPDAPGGSWWPTSFLAPMAVIGPHADRAVAAMAEAVAALEAEGIPRRSIWLGGFSQGAVLALETFARQGAGLAGGLRAVGRPDRDRGCRGRARCSALGRRIEAVRLSRPPGRGQGPGLGA